MTIKQGVPQGSVPSPFLFLLYINDLPPKNSPHISLCADDVTVWAQDANPHKAERREALNRIDRWRQEWKIEISAQKSECSFFSTNTHEAKWRPTLNIRGEEVLAEANLPTIETRGNQLSTIAMEKPLRQPNTKPWTPHSQDRREGPQCIRHSSRQIVFILPSRDKGSEDSTRDHTDGRHHQESPIGSDSLSVLQRLQQIHPSEPPMNNDERDITILLTEISSRGCQLTSTWCPSHCGLIGNEMADCQAKDGATKPQTGASCHYQSAKSVIRKMTRGAPLMHERTRWVYGDHGEKINRQAEREKNHKDQTTLSRLRSGHHPDLKYWLAKIKRAADISCRKCGLYDETVEHEVYECPSIHNPSIEHPAPDILAKDPRQVLITGEMDIYS